MFTMKQFAFIAILVQSLTAANMPMPDFSQNQKIAVQNTILSQVNGRTISVLDVKKKMDLVFYQNYPQLAESSQARYQFYQTSWRRVLMEMIDNELILADAQDKEIKLTDGEVREAIEERFGPNVVETLDKIGLTYDEAWKMIKEDMIVQRMSWWFVHSRAISSVTPKDIKEAYRLYLKANPAYVEMKYRVITVRDADLAEKTHQLLSGKRPEEVELGEGVTLSNEFVAKDIELSDSHRNALSHLEPGTYSPPLISKGTYKIFYLVQKTEHPAPAFEDLSNHLRNELTQKAVAKESENYVGKLRKHYGFESQKLVAENVQPFSIQ